jgi:hypothetical protein
VRVRLGRDPGRSVIFDAPDGSEVRVYGDDALEGQSAWSYLLAIEPCEEDCRRKDFAEATKELEAARDRHKEAFNTSFTAREFPQLRQRLVLVGEYAIIPFMQSRVLRFGPRCSPHECFELYAQQTNVFCAVATGQMILDFYRRPFSQDEIAVAMGTGAGGTSWAGQEQGYISLSNGCLEAAHDYSPTWAKGKAQIDANRPFKSGIPGHARACAGWQRQLLFLLPRISQQRWLQIYDPWPWNSDICAGGAVYWEEWTSQTHTNLCPVWHATTQH